MGSGKRDFGELTAKLSEHVERLPDYAQRAQDKLQRYLPVEQQRDDSSAPRSTSRPPVRSPQSKPAAELPILADVRSKWAQWNDPAAKLDRRKRRTARALTLWIVLSILCCLLIVAGVAGVSVAGDITNTIISGSAGVVVFGALGVRSGQRLRQLNRTEVPTRTAEPALPPTDSLAREPMERLSESEASLGDLLTQLSAPTSSTAVGVPEVSVSDARSTASEAAAALRGLAARIQAIERARTSSPVSERAALDSAVRTLREQLDDGLKGYGELVAAAGRAVAASSGGVQPSKQALIDATDNLAGLAVALRELA